MKRVMLLVTVALMLAAAMALSGMAQAKPITTTKADKKCLVEAVRTVEQPGFNPSDYTFFGGTESGGTADLVTTEGPDVFCGFGGDDFVGGLRAGDIFLGGEGNDTVTTNRGTFYGGAGDDEVRDNDGTFDGGEDNDTVMRNFPGGTIINVEQVGV